MGSILVFLTGLLIVAIWWLSRQGVLSKPWLEQGVAVDFTEKSDLSSSAARTGLAVFLAVVGSLFALFLSAYALRMQLPDWRDVPLPAILWLNTGMLILSSVALQGARKAAREGEEDALKLGLLAAGVTALAFLSGQLLAWRQLNAEGYLLASNSANAFFYVLTGIHGLHLLGGLIALGRTILRAWRGTTPERLQISVGLCATYWHFMLLVWLVLLSVLAGWAGNVIDICRQILS
ncbi:cytochrome c oxidase subunit 3 [Microvirga solisilvae]|uniref:cytochrome c oxidase subunit 3 n=1 Tax=Microvirga solisilvae TaxID=2919498 RepID=UPI001FAEE3EB|nr:cytochrome c oxidase subunit 3 [Microvirga solisilvae]